MRDGFDLLSQKLPRSLSREGRVALVAAVIDALLSGELPDREAALFVGGALQAWAKSGGPLERHLRVGAKRGSHRTAQVVFHSVIADEGRLDDKSLDSELLNREESES